MRIAQFLALKSVKCRTVFFEVLLKAKGEMLAMLRSRILRVFLSKFLQQRL